MFGLKSIFQPEVDELSNFTDDEVQTAALNVLYLAGDKVDTRRAIWGGTVAACNIALARIENLRKKYEDYKPTRMRKAILAWFDHFEYMVRQNLEDCRTNKSLADHQKYEAERKVKSERQNLLRNQLKEIQ